MYKSREGQTELLLSILNGRNPNCCSLVLLFHSSPPLTMSTVNPITDTISRKLIPWRRKSFLQDQLAEPTDTDTSAVSRNGGDNVEPGTEQCSSHTWLWHQLLGHCSSLQNGTGMPHLALPSWFCGGYAYWTLGVKSNTVNRPIFV